MITVASALRDGTARLQGPDAALEARLLLAHAMDVPRDRLILLMSDEVSLYAWNTYCLCIENRLAQMPISRIIGRRALWGRDFVVTPDVLDPRPDTETLIEQALSGPIPRRVLDMGTGSGCIIVTLLAEWPETNGIATDISDAALAIAEKNALNHGVMGRLTLINSNWFEAISDRFDLIVSNPPYIATAEMAELSPEVINHDPHIALTPGGDGLDAYRTICAHAPQHLAPNGSLLLEIGWTQAEDVTEIAKNAGFSKVKVLQDIEGRDRVIAASCCV